MANAPAHRLGYIDCLRCLGAGAVVFQHAGEHLSAGPVRSLVALGPGVFGVALFFIISGFVIPFSVRRHFDPREFAVRRIMRIYPLVLAAFLLCLLLGVSGVVPRFASMLHARPVVWAANLLLVQDLIGVRPFLNVTWTLILELGWYALFAAVTLRFRDRAGSILAIAGPLVMIGIALLSLAIGQRIPLGRIGMLYAAIFGYQVYRHHVGEVGNRALIVNLLAFWTVMFAGNYVAFGHFQHPRISFAQAAGPWFAATVLFMAVYGVRWLREGALIDNPVFRALGTISFSTYMLHIVAIAIALRHGGTWWLPVALGLTLIFSIAGYYGIERPGIAFGRRISRALRPEPQPVPA